MVELGKWQWQEPGTAWRGVGVYHVTLTVPSREPLLGTLVIPDHDPSKARIERTALGNAVVDELYVMPDHLHAVIHVTQVISVCYKTCCCSPNFFYFFFVRKLIIATFANVIL